MTKAVSEAGIYWRIAMNQRRLFIASCVALIATAMSFAIRGDIIGQVQVD